MRFRKLERHTVVVHLSGEGAPSIKGVLRHVNRDSLMLTGATHLDTDQTLEGDVLIPRERVDFLQRIPAE